MATLGKLFVISAPSGAGKTTLVRKVLDRFPRFSYSVSHTTRPPREKEIHGRDYFFISAAEFEAAIEKGLWLEWARVHDNYYGTSRAFVEENLRQGKSILLDIDVQGALQIMGSGLDPVSIFILPPSFEILEQRLRGRGTDSEAVIQKRLKNAVFEMARKDDYRYVIINDDLDTAVRDLSSVFQTELGIK